MHRIWSAMIALALSGCVSGQGVAPPVAADIAAADLPQAAANPALQPETRLSRITVGSCNRQDYDQGFWTRVAATSPQLFLMIGDNVYGDIGWDGEADLGTFRAAYASLAAEPDFAALRAQVPMMVTWDDHDFGPNDGGGSFPYKAFSQQVFEHFWSASPEVRGRDGVYQSVTTGPAGQRVQVILLDTRFFRSDLSEAPQDQQAGRLGRFMPSSDPASTVLGEQQWQWLEQELAEPADLRIVASSIQVLTEAHHFESWANFPHERTRLLDLLAHRSTSGLLLLSGDRHMAAFYEGVLPGGERVWEMTTSSLNAPLPFVTPTSREPDPARQSPMITAANFGTLEISWNTRMIGLNVEGSDGIRRARRTVSF